MIPNPHAVFLSSPLVAIVQSVMEKRAEDTTPEQLADLVKDAQNESTFSVSERASLLLYVVLADVKEHSAIPALLEEYQTMIHEVYWMNNDVDNDVDVDY